MVDSPAPGKGSEPRTEEQNLASPFSFELAALDEDLRNGSLNDEKDKQAEPPGLSIPELTEHESAEAYDGLSQLRRDYLSPYRSTAEQLVGPHLEWRAGIWVGNGATSALASGLLEWQEALENDPESGHILQVNRVPFEISYVLFLDDLQKTELAETEWGQGVKLVFQRGLKRGKEQLASRYGKNIEDEAEAEVLALQFCGVVRDILARYWTVDDPSLPQEHIYAVERFSRFCLMMGDEMYKEMRSGDPEEIVRAVKGEDLSFGAQIVAEFARRRDPMFVKQLLQVGVED